MNGDLNKDKLWVETNILKGEDIFLYGALAEDETDLGTDDFWSKFRLICEEYLNAKDKRTELFHQKIDELLEALIERDKRYGYPPPFCHKGCANCCHEIVYCTNEEIQLIIDFCQANKISIDLLKIKRQLKHIDFDKNNDHTGFTTWSEQEEKDQACLFLDPIEKSCQIWPVRPFVCRVHLAEETDCYCRPLNGEANPMAKGISYPEWSYLLSAIFTIHRTSIKKTMIGLLQNILKN